MSAQRSRLRTAFSKCLVAAGLTFGTGFATAGVIEGTLNADGITGGSRWDYATRTVLLQGQAYERSLSNGLTFNLQGGSYEAYRDLFTWAGAKPTVAAFQSAVEQAFNAWTTVDPVSRFGTKIKFQFDSTIPMFGINTNTVFDARGAEIDLFGSDVSALWGSSSAGTRGLTNVGEVISTVKLTSGVANYANSRAITGADIVLNSQASAAYTLDIFRRVLTHEIGHALGLGDLDVGTVKFLDNNYVGTSAATRLATLTDSWAALVNPLDPSHSNGLHVYTVSGSVFGTPGVNLLMESNGLGIAEPGNPVTSLVPLTNDEYGTRQFLYPELTTVPVPEPAQYWMFALGLLGVLGWRALRTSR